MLSNRALARSKLGRSAGALADARAAAAAAPSWAKAHARLGASACPRRRARAPRRAAPRAPLRRTTAAATAPSQPAPRRRPRPRSGGPARAALHAANRFTEAVTAFERAAWLARAHEADGAAADEYEEAALAAKAAQMARGARRDDGRRDGF